MKSNQGRAESARSFEPAVGDRRSSLLYTRGAITVPTNDASGDVTAHEPPLPVSSPLVTKLSHYTALTPISRARLRRLEKATRSYRRGDPVSSSGVAASELFIVKTGWFFDYAMLPDGGRHILRVHQPGDIIGLAALTYDTAPWSVCAASAGALHPIRRGEFSTAFMSTPELATALLSLVVRDSMSLTDLLRATNRMAPLSRLAYFLLEMLTRLRVSSGRSLKRFRLPLTQTEIGDATGLTNVTISRTFRRLEERNLVSRLDGIITVKDEAQLATLSDFHDRHSTSAGSTTSRAFAAV